MHERFALGLIACLVTACGTSSGPPAVACAPDCPARIVAQGSSPLDLAVDADSVYWIDEGGSGATPRVNRTPRGGGQTTALASGGRPVAIALDDASVYWLDADGGSIKRVAKQGGAPDTLVANDGATAGLAIDGGRLFWESFKGLRSVATTGGAPQTIAPGTYPGSNVYFRVVVDATNVYWADNGVIRRAPRNGGDAVTLRSGPGEVYDLAVDGAALDFAMGGLASQPGVYSVPSGGGTATQLAESDGDVSGIALAAPGEIYWSDTTGGRVMFTQGASATAIAKSTHPSRIVTSGSTIFWVDRQEGAIKASGD